MQFNKADGGCRGTHDFVQLVDDALFADDANAFAVASQCLKGFVGNGEVELGGEAHAAHHAERVIAEGDVGVQRRHNQFVLQVLESTERVGQFAEASTVETNRKGVDGEIAPLLVVLQSAVLANRVA